MEHELESTEETSVDDAVGIHEVLDLFSNMSPKKCAKFVSVAVDKETKITHTLALSPEHRSLIEQNKKINVLTKNCPERAQQLKEIAAETYIVSKRKKQEYSLLSKRSIDFNNSQEATPSTEDPLLKDGKLDDNQLPGRKRRRSNVNWNKITGTTFQTELECQTHIRDKFPTLRLKETGVGKDNNRKYQCYEDSTQPMKQRTRGSCYALIVSTTASATSTSNTCILLKTSMDSKCICRLSDNIQTRQGLPATLKARVSDLSKFGSGLQPNQIKNRVLHDIVDGHTDGDNSEQIKDIELNSNKRIDVTKQIKNRVNYERKLAREKGETATHVHYVGDLIDLKEKYTFKLPFTVPFPCMNESSLQRLGGYLFDFGQLKLLPTKNVTEIKRNAFRLMTILNPKVDVSDSNTSEPEKKLYTFIEKCRVKCPALEEREGNPYDTTTVFSSLAF